MHRGAVAAAAAARVGAAPRVAFQVRSRRASVSHASGHRSRLVTASRACAPGVSATSANMCVAALEPILATKPAADSDLRCLTKSLPDGHELAQTLRLRRWEKASRVRFARNLALQQLRAGSTGSQALVPTAPQCALERLPVSVPRVSANAALAPDHRICSVCTTSKSSQKTRGHGSIAWKACLSVSAPC